MYRSERQRRNMRNSLGLAPLRRVLNHSGGSHRRMSILVDLLKTRLMRKLCVTPPLMCLNRSLRQGMKLRVGYILTTAIIHCFGHCKCFLYAFHMGRRCETHAAYYLRRPCNDATLELIRARLRIEGFTRSLVCQAGDAKTQKFEGGRAQEVIDAIRHGDALTLHRAEGVVVSIVADKVGAAAEGNVLVINGSKWELPARLARLFVASPRLASVQLRPDLVEPGTRGSVEKVLSFILEAGYWYAVEDELDDLYDEVSDGMDDFYDIEVREDI